MVSATKAIAFIGAVTVASVNAQNPLFPCGNWGVVDLDDGCPASNTSIVCTSGVDTLGANVVPSTIATTCHTTIYVPAYGLTGSIPAITSTMVQQVYLQENAISGPFPALAAASSLNTIDVSNNQLTGDIETIIGSLPTSLRSIDIMHNQITGNWSWIGAHCSSRPNTVSFMADGNNLIGCVRYNDVKDCGFNTSHPALCDDLITDPPTPMPTHPTPPPTNPTPQPTAPTTPSPTDAPVTSGPTVSPNTNAPTLSPVPTVPPVPTQPPSSATSLVLSAVAALVAGVLLFF